MRNAVIRDYEWSRRHAMAGNDGHVPHGMSAALADDGQAPPQAVVVSGAGVAGANGIYKMSGKEKCGAPVYRHTESEAIFSIAREPQVSRKTGKTKHGWLLAESGAGLYGVPTESLVVPSSGWKAFDGTPPTPTVEVHRLLAEVLFAAADAARFDGEQALEQEAWESAISAFDSGLDSLERSGDRFGEPFERRAALLFSRRAAANGKLGRHRDAMRDAVAAMELVPALECATAAATRAAVELGCRDEREALELLEVAGTGQILDRGAPLCLGDVERWVEEVARAARARAASEPEATKGAEAAAAGAGGRGTAVEARPVVEVTPEYHRGFMSWINFLRADPLEDDMYRDDWAEMVGRKLSSLNWKFTARRVGVDTAGDTQTEAVLRLMAAYEKAGQPPGPPLPKPEKTAAEHLLNKLAHSVHKVEEESVPWDSDQALEAGMLAPGVHVPSSLKLLN